MAQVMIQILNKKNGTLVAGMDCEVLRAFMTYHWPGNARELRNVIEHATIVAGTGMLHLCHVPSTTFGQKTAAPVMGSITLLPGSSLSEIEESYITLTLQYANHNLHAGGRPAWNHASHAAEADRPISKRDESSDVQRMNSSRQDEPHSPHRFRP